MLESKRAIERELKGDRPTDNFEVLGIAIEAYSYSPLDQARNNIN